MNSSDKLLKIKVSINEEIETYDLNIDKNEKIKNLKNVIARKLNLDINNLYLLYNNIVIGEINNGNDYILHNLIDNNTTPHFHIIFKNNGSEDTNSKNTFQFFCDLI